MADNIQAVKMKEGLLRIILTVLLFYLLFFNTFEIAFIIESFPYSYVNEPCIYNRNGSLRGASAESSIVEPSVKHPAAITTSQG